MDSTGNFELDRELERVKAQFDQLNDIQSKMSEISGTGQDEDGYVHASVGATGEISEVTIDPRAMRIGSELLAQAVTTAVRLAQADLRRAMMELVAPVVEVSPTVKKALYESAETISMPPADIINAPGDVVRSNDPLGEATRQLMRLRNLL